MNIRFWVGEMPKRPTVEQAKATRLYEKTKKKRKKEKKNPPNSHHLSPAERLGAGTSVRIHPVAQVQDVPGRIDVPIPHGPAVGTGLEPPAAKGGRTAHPSHALAMTVTPGEPRELPPDKGQR